MYVYNIDERHSNYGKAVRCVRVGVCVCDQSLSLPRYSRVIIVTFSLTDSIVISVISSLCWC